MPLPPSIKMAQENAAANAAAKSGGFSFSGLLSKSNLLSVGATVGLTLAERFLRDNEPRYQTGETRTTVQTQWPSRRIFGELEVGGQAFWAGGANYIPGAWSPPTGLPDGSVYLPPTGGKDPKVSLLDNAIWLAEGTLTGLKGVRLGDQYVELTKTVIDGVDHYTPTTGNPLEISPYAGTFYLRAYFGVDKTDQEFLTRYSGDTSRDIEDKDESRLWQLKRKDANHSWVAMTFVDTSNRNVWENFSDFTRLSFIVEGQKVSDMTAPTDKAKLVYTDNVAAVQHWIECNLIEKQDYDSVSHRHFQDAYNWAAITHDNEYEQFISLPDGRQSRVTQGKRLPFYRDMPLKSKNGTLNIVIEETTDVSEFRDSCDTIRQGFTYDYAGKLCVTTGQNLDMTNAVAIDSKDIIDIRPAPQPRRQGNPNSLRARMAQSQAHGYQPVELEIGDQYSIDRDGGKVTQNLGNLVGMTDYMEVVRKMNSLVYRQRFNQIWRVTLLPHYKYLKALPDDPILLNSKMARVENHPTRIVAKEIEQATGQVTFILRYAPHNEFLSKQSLPPIEQPPGRAPLPHAITDLVFHGRPGTKFGYANVSLEWDSPRYYKTTIISWREQGGEWNAGIPVENDRTDTQRYSLDGVDFKVATTYDFEVVNENGHGDRSAPYQESWTARSDTAAPPAPSGVVATGLVQGVHISRTEIDPATVPDYSKTTATITYTPTGGSSKSVTKEFSGTDAEWRFPDIGKNETISLSIVVKDVDTAGNESTGVTVATSTESAYEVSNLFGDGFGIGARFVYDNYIQLTPAESPPDPWDPSSWYIRDFTPPSGNVPGPPLTRTLFENIGKAGTGNDLIGLNSVDQGQVSLEGWLDANSQRAAGPDPLDLHTFALPKFAGTLVKASLNDNYWGVIKLTDLRFNTTNHQQSGPFSEILLRGIWIHTHFEEPYPTFGSGVGNPTMTLDFQLARGAKGDRGDRGLPGNRGLPGGRGERGLPGVDGDEWRFVIQDTATAGTPTITNKTDRTVDPGVPAGWKKFNSGDADLQIDNVLKPFRWEAASQKVNGRWGDWQIILLSVGGERVQAFFIPVPRHAFVEWRKWKTYTRANGRETVTDYPESEKASRWVAGRTPPVPGKQYGNNPTFPQKIVSGSLSASTPADTIHRSTALFRMDVRYRVSESDSWVVLPHNNWNFGVITTAQAEAAGRLHFEEYCTHRYYDSETLGRYQDFVTPEYCRTLDHEAFVPVGGTNGQVLFHGSTDTYWKKVEMADIEGFTGTGGQWTNIRAEVTQLLADVATLKAAPAPVDPITIAFNMITYKSFRATISGGGSGNYGLRYKKFSDNTWITLASQTANHFDVPQSPRTLEAGVTYDVQATVGSLPYSPTHTVTTLTQTAPAPPINFSVSRTGSMITATWREGTAGKGATWDSVNYYRVLLLSDSNPRHKDVTTTTVSFTLDNIERLFNIGVRIIAYNSVGGSSPVEKLTRPPSSGGDQ